MFHMHVKARKTGHIALKEGNTLIKMLLFFAFCLFSFVELVKCPGLNVLANYFACLASSDL